MLQNLIFSKTICWHLVYRDYFNIIYHQNSTLPRSSMILCFRQIKSSELVLHEMILQEDWARRAEKINLESSTIR